MSGAPPRHRLTLTETEYRIVPVTPTAARTGRIAITVRNSGRIVHALAVKTPSGLLTTADLAPGAATTITVEVSRPAAVAFFCPIAGHAGLGMHGVLLVGQADAGGRGPAGAGGGAASSSSAGGMFH